MSDAAPIAKFLRNNVIAILYLYLMVLEFGNYLQAAPRAAIYEGIICHRQERPKASELASSIHDTGHAQNHCKGHAVQDELAFVRGMQEMFDCLPGMLETWYIVSREPVLALQANPSGQAFFSLCRMDI
jgi:hypothetical protein